ncbi:unnamed protein product [Tetraodon nigroviridis]|uniref:Chromosome 10 SCAF15019, whole genome shotgun sequence n=1 Tax=Tetraodon nigroviridis TaxID=99883 RepID=Q4RMJ0_TETNG|nr:unnamed protein product [Tetraodon nigroviridis]
MSHVAHLQRLRIHLHFSPHDPERMPPCAVHRHTTYCKSPVPTTSAISSVRAIPTLTSPPPGDSHQAEVCGAFQQGKDSGSSSSKEYYFASVLLKRREKVWKMKAGRERLQLFRASALQTITNSGSDDTLILSS